MADLYVLEGRDGKRKYQKTNHPIRPRSRHRHTHVPGIVLGGSFLSKIGSVVKSATKVAVSPITATYSVTKSAASATGHAILNPSLSNVTKIATNPLTRAKNESVSTAKEAGHSVMESARAGSIALDVTRRVAKRLIKTVAKKVLFHGDSLLGDSVAAVPKNAAKGVLIPVATAAVLANTVTAPAAPVVPVLVNEVIDELYSAMSKAIAKGLSPSDAAKAAQADLDKLEPGEENDPKVGGLSFLPVAIGVAALIGIFALWRHRE